MTDPHLPPGWQDELILAINAEELYRRRTVRGQDINDWHPQIRTWLAEGHLLDALDLLEEILDVVEILEQYDAREPDWYWYSKTASVQEELGDCPGAAATLRRYLQAWPAHRGVPEGLRAAVDRRRSRAAAWAHRLEGSSS